jgi:GNAT superfamily N-acetyltransferase
VAEVSALRDLEELRGYTQSNPLSVSQQEAIEELSNRQKAASAAGTVSPFQSSFNPFNPNFRATAQNAISNMLGGSNISSSDNYLGGRVANTLTGLLDFAPVVGDAVGVGDTITSYRQGDIPSTVINAAATGIGVLPLVGGPASKAVKAGGNRVRSALRGIDPSLPKYEGMRDATVQHLKNKGIMSQREFDRAERDSFEKTGNWDSMPEPEAVYTIDDSGSNSSYVTIKKPKNYAEEGMGDPDEYTIRFSDHSLPKQYAYDQNIYNVSDDYYDETINGKTLNDAIDYADRLVPSSSVALGETPSVRDGARSALRDIGENAPTNPQTSIEQISQDIESRYGLDSFTAYEKGDDVTLGMITVPKDKRKQGVGSAAMNDLIEYADTNNKRVKLTPDVKGSDQGTTSRKRLVDFYKRFGFVENKGRNKDFTVSEGMFRLPKSR